MRKSIIRRVGASGLGAAIALAGLFLIWRPYYPSRDLVLGGFNDFPHFYCGAQLLGTGNLYDPAAMRVAQEAVLRKSCPFIQYIRLPYVAVLTLPFTLLPYKTAYVVWQLLCLAAIAGFIWWWPARRTISLLLCCWFPPVAASFANGQDIPFLLLWAALSVVLLRKNLPFVAGMVLALCAAKFHLFVYLPVVLIAGRLWRVTAGVVAGGALLLAMSFAGAGWNWPIELYHALLDPSVGHALSGVSLIDLLQTHLSRPWFIAAAGLAALACAAAVWIAARRLDFAFALSVAMAAGTLTAYHLYQQDYLVCLPLLALLVDRFFEPAVPEPATA